jgi:hypothetical protein
LRRVSALDKVVESHASHHSLRDAEGTSLTVGLTNLPYVIEKV